MKSVLISEKESDQNFSFEKLIDLVTTQIDANLVSEFCHAYGLLMTSQALATLLANRLEWAFEQKNHPFHHELVKVRIYVILNRWIDIFSCSSHDRVVTLKRDVSSGGKNASSDFDIDVIRILEQAIDRIRNCQKLFLSADNSNIITSTDRLPSPEDRQILRELKDSLRKFNTVPNETRKPIKSKNTYQNTQSGVVKKSLGLILNCFKGKLSSNIDYHIPRSIHTLSYNDGCSIFLKESSKTISEQLCLFEAAVMRQVNWIELINYGRKGGIIGFTLENYIGKFSGMSRWMMSDVIYRAKSFDERLNIIRKMIRVADVSFYSNKSIATRKYYSTSIIFQISN